MKVTDFRWLDKVDDREFDISGDWPDFADDPTLGDRDSLMMIGHNGLWQPGHEDRRDRRPAARRRDRPDPPHSVPRLERDGRLLPQGRGRAWP